MPFILSILMLFCCVSCGRRNTAPQQEKLPNVLSEKRTGGYVLRLVADRDEFSIDTPFHLKAEAEYPSGSRLTRLDLTPERLKAFECIRLQGKPESQLEDCRLTQSQELLLDPWISEKYEIPAISATFVDADGHEQSVTTDAIELSIAQKDDAYWQELDVKFADGLERSLTPGATFRRLVLTAAIALIAVLAAICALLLFRRRKPSVPVVQEIPPYEQAIADLDSLLKQELLLHGEIKQYYTGLSDILRRYIERRFSLSAPKQTTQEFISGIISGGDNALQPYSSMLKTFLMECDMVKFAKSEPLATEGDAAASTCRQFLESTRPREEPSPAPSSTKS